MDQLGSLITIALGVMLVNNFVLARFLGLCPFIGVSRRTSSALGMGLAVTFVMTMASIATYLLYTYILHYGPQNIFAGTSVFTYAAAGNTTRFDPMVLERVLRTVSYILVIAALVQLVEMVIRKVSRPLYKALGIYLPLITTNCAVMGVALLNTTDAAKPLTFLQATTQGLFAGVGFTIAMLLMSGIREQLETADVPKPLQGVPIAFVCTSLMSISFMAFAGMV